MRKKAVYDRYPQDVLLSTLMDDPKGLWTDVN